MTLERRTFNATHRLDNAFVALKVHKALYSFKVLARLLDFKSALRVPQSEADLKSAALAAFSGETRGSAWQAGLALTVLALSGCGGLGEIGGGTTLTVQQPANEKFFPSDEPYRLGAEQFNRGNYGLAEEHFREAVEKAPGNGAAWVALASSYDRLRRFDLADRAYARAVELLGETAQLLNNQGYSQMLRGNVKEARRKFLRAAALDPGNPTIENNINLLNGGSAYLTPASSTSRGQ